MNGSELRITRLALGLSQPKMATLVKKGIKTIKQYENREYQPAESVTNTTTAAFDSMIKKLEPYMALRAGQAERTLWTYSSDEELHEHQPEFSDWNLDTYNAFLGHAITILKLRGISYRVLTPKADI